MNDRIGAHDESKKPDRANTANEFLAIRPEAVRNLRRDHAGRAEAAGGDRQIREGQRVVCSDGEFGRVNFVLVDKSTDRVTHLVVRHGGQFGRDLVIPVDWVREMSDERLVLDEKREQLEGAPEYRPDEEISDAVLDTLWYHSNLDPSDLQGVGVRSRDGVLVLDGHTRTEEARQQIEAAASQVPGVLRVRNRIKAQEEAA